MTNSNPDKRDLSRACWRCQHFDGVVAEVHASCKRGAGSLQASPVRGCVFWESGAGDAQPIDWMPPGLRLSDRKMIWGDGPSAAPPAPPSWETGRPGRASEAAEWAREHERKAWRATDAFLGKFRGPRRQAPASDALNAREHLWQVTRPAISGGPDDMPADIPT